MFRQGLAQSGAGRRSAEKYAHAGKAGRVPVWPGAGPVRAMQPKPQLASAGEPH